eukprot:CAMPEP_0170745914 /NCGR_PEP_ID=MMETSP0437-20130122/8535_1 /TAXON_ID=0 /ORGANISM="Sexangularia sp." /LENGTH=736 /DNA_ID=CAMNT_0011084641 /DNA_START=137 /DNA_END=2347 /DNA_ORIENTATION=+
MRTSFFVVLALLSQCVVHCQKKREGGIDVAAIGRSSCDVASLPQRCIQLCGSREAVARCPTTCGQLVDLGISCVAVSPQAQSSWWSLVSGTTRDVRAALAATFDSTLSSLGLVSDDTSSSSKGTPGGRKGGLGSKKRRGDLEVRRMRRVGRNHAQFMLNLTTEHVPVVLWNAPFLDRARFLRWTPDNLARRAGERRLGVKAQPDSGTFFTGCCELTPMTIGKFVETAHLAAESDPPSAYYYLNAPVHVLGDRADADVGTLPFMTVLDKGDNEVPADDYRKVWLGSKGTVTPWHYDAFEGFLISVYGTRTVSLYPPSFYRDFYVFPKGHPAHRQSQLRVTDFDSPDLDLTKFPNAAKLRDSTEYPLKVTLEAGDVLYIPSFWFHSVVSETESIAVNRWFTNVDVFEMDNAWQARLPFSRQDAYRQPIESIATLRQVILGVVKHSLAADPGLFEGSTEAALAYLNDHVASRYTPLYGAKAHPNADIFAGVGSMKDPHVVQHRKEQDELDASILMSRDFVDYCGPGHLFALDKLGEFGGLSGESYIREIVSYFSFHRVSPDVRAVFLGDWIDDIVGSVVGDDNVHLFLERCFTKYNPPPIEREADAARLAETPAKARKESTINFINEEDPLRRQTALEYRLALEAHKREAEEKREEFLRQRAEGQERRRKQAEEARARLAAKKARAAETGQPAAEDEDDVLAQSDPNSAPLSADRMLALRMAALQAEQQQEKEARKDEL